MQQDLTSTRSHNTMTVRYHYTMCAACYDQDIALLQQQSRLPETTHLSLSTFGSLRRPLTCIVLQYVRAMADFTIAIQDGPQLAVGHLHRAMLLRLCNPEAALADINAFLDQKDRCCGSGHRTQVLIVSTLSLCALSYSHCSTQLLTMNLFFTSGLLIPSSRSLLNLYHPR